MGARVSCSYIHSILDQPYFSGRHPGRNSFKEAQKTVVAQQVYTLLVSLCTRTDDNLCIFEESKETGNLVTTEIYMRKIRDSFFLSFEV